jgi:hypothetical protein
MKKPNCEFRVEGHHYYSGRKILGCRKYGNVCYPSDECIEDTAKIVSSDQSGDEKK